MFYNFDTRCHLNKSIEKAFIGNGYEVEVRAFFESHVLKINLRQYFERDAFNYKN